jgi:putative Ca2+/H+ antiporter (TMEM165/GDT1 family)
MNSKLGVKPEISVDDLASHAPISQTMLQQSEEQPELSTPSLPVADGGMLDSADSQVSQPRWQFWQVFSSTFITIFLAELGDKTQVSTLLLTAKFHNPWMIFAGAAGALISTSLLGVWFGCWLSSRLSPQVLDKAAGMMLALISIWLLLEAVQR